MAWLFFFMCFSKAQQSHSLLQFVFMFQHQKSQKGFIFKSFFFFWHFALCWICSHSKMMLCHVTAISYYGLKKKEVSPQHLSCWIDTQLIENNIGWATYVSNHHWQLSILAATNEFEVSLEIMMSSCLWKPVLFSLSLSSNLRFHRIFPPWTDPKETKQLINRIKSDTQTVQLKLKSDMIIRLCKKWLNLLPLEIQNFWF